MNVTKQQGFTLIELVMVIVILGILAATALPKFVDMTSSARESTLKGLAGAINGAKSIVKAGYLLAPAATVALSDGTTVAVSTSGTVAGYPLATALGVRAAIDISSDFADTYATTGGNVATFTLDGKTSCTVTYTESTAAVVVDPSGC